MRIVRRGFYFLLHKAFDLLVTTFALAEPSSDYPLLFAAMSQANGIATSGMPFSSWGV
jgi:hypothetical protein